MGMIGGWVGKRSLIDAREMKDGTNVVLGEAEIASDFDGILMNEKFTADKAGVQCCAGHTRQMPFCGN